MIGLGPVLDHMCVGEDIDCGFQTFELLDARSKPLKELNKVVMSLGRNPAESIQKLISPKSTDTYEEGHTPQAITSLSLHEQSIKNTASSYTGPSPGTHGAGLWCV